MKTCARCGQTKPLDDFTADRRARDGRYSACKACNAAAAKAKRDADPAPSRAAVSKWKKATPENTAQTAQWIKEWHERNPESHRATMRRQAANRRARKVAEYWSGDPLQMHCGICKTTEPTKSGKGFHLDHDHETGKVREFLCHNCNVGLGHFKDDPDLLIEATMYLMRHKGMLESLLPDLETDKEG